METKQNWSDPDSNKPIDFSKKPLPELEVTPEPKEAHEGLRRQSTWTMPVPKVSTCVLTANNNSIKSTLPLSVKVRAKKRVPPKLLWIGETKVAGQMFWFSKKKGCGFQQFIFNRAERLKHRACVVLQHHGRRLYTTFASAGVFWDYLKERYFYWINRSCELSKEASLLHFDLEWYTDVRDPKIAPKLIAIRSAINAALPHAVEILQEDRSRSLLSGKYKNSFHLYALITLSHNGGGCMRP